MTAEALWGALGALAAAGGLSLLTGIFWRLGTMHATLEGMAGRVERAEREIQELRGELRCSSI